MHGSEGEEYGEHEKGVERAEEGPPSAPARPNAQVCLDSNPDAFFRFYLSRLAAP